MKKLTALMIAAAMVWIGFASSSFAFSSAAQMVNMNDDTSMASMNMSDCPSHKAGQMKMDGNKCVVACYGLATSVALDFTPLRVQVLHIAEVSTELTNRDMASHVLGVPTPPPNFV